MLSNNNPAVDLDGFHLRFNNDHREAGSFWQNIVENTWHLKVSMISDSVSTLTSSSLSLESISIPVYSETSAGKNYIKSLRKLSEIDEKVVL